APVILSVGRFFPASRGHSKRQLELVHAFGDLVESGLTGWELHLVGGCQPEDRGYLEQVRSAAAGLPVSIRVDAPGSALSELYGRASVYWHATGLGEDPARAPERQEHFGLAVVEAMSAGAVPVVHAGAGPAETVLDGVEGFHFSTTAELAERTTAVIADPGLLSAPSAAAERGAARYSAPALAAPATPTLAWEKVLPGAAIRESSATPGVLDGAGNSVVVGSLDGKVYAFHESDGSATPGWPVQTSNGINSSASIADTNGDGAAEVFIGSGRYDQSPAGALYSFAHDGRQRFRQAEGSPGAIGAPPFPETAIHTTPALGDISHSGVVDVVSPALGLQAYAYSESGGLLGGWPYYTDDTVFSSP